MSQQTKRRIGTGKAKRLPGQVSGIPDIITRNLPGGSASGSTSGGQMRRRTSKGITGRELKAFRRVTAVLDKYAKTPPPMRARSRKSTRAKC